MKTIGLYGKKNALWLGILLAGLMFPAGVRAAASPPREYRIKAVFLFNFVQFVDWPAHAFASADGPLLIGVLGDDPFGPFLDETVRGETVGNRPLLVRRYRSVDQIQNCQVLYISRSEAGAMPEILRRLKGRNILIVSDADNFAQNGGMIQFVTENKKIRLRINVGATKAADLVISSKLLRLSEIIESTQGGMLPLYPMGVPRALLARGRLAPAGGPTG